MITLYSLNNIEFAYDCDPALSIQSLDISQGGITALVGPNGAGKSTLLNMLAFVHPPDKGRLCFLGQDVTVDNYNRLRRRVAYVQQAPYLFHNSVRNNIELGLKIRGMAREERRRRSDRYIRNFNLEHLSDRNAHELSGGEVRKVAIARALILEAQVLILDEPFTHLDKAFRLELEELLKKVANENSVTILFTTHDYGQAQVLATRTLSLVDGNLVPMPVSNLFTGTCRAGIFDTGRTIIHLPVPESTGTRLVVDSNQLVLSREELSSSMRNSYLGRISRLAEENGVIHVVVQAQETFHVSITPAAMAELRIGIGEPVWVSFKSTAVHLF